MDVQRLRNLTTGVVHTKPYHMFFDIEFLTGVIGISIKDMSLALKALKPWLRDQVDDDSFWIPEMDVSNQGQYDIQPMSNEEKAAFLKRYYNQSSKVSEDGSVVSVSSDLIVINPCGVRNNTFNFTDPNSSGITTEYVYHGKSKAENPEVCISLSNGDVLKFQNPPQPLNG